MNNPKAAIEYAQKLHAYSQEAKEDLLVIMRVYFEKWVFVVTPELSKVKTLTRP